MEKELRARARRVVASGDRDARVAWFADLDRAVARFDGDVFGDIARGDEGEETGEGETSDNANDDDEQTESKGYFATRALAAYAREHRGRVANGERDDESDATSERREELNKASDLAFMTRVMALCERGSAEALRADAKANALAHACRGMSERACRYGNDDDRARAMACLARCVDVLTGERREALTPQHGDFLRVALKKKAYDAIAASGFVDGTATEVDPTLTGIDSTSYLTYCYYSGRALLALRRYEDAAVAFSDAVGAPAKVVSAIVVAAYKKFVLATLLSEARAPTLPKHVSAPVKRYIAVGKEFEGYLELGSAFDKCDAVALERAIENHATAFASDGNAGLVMLLRDAWRRAKVRRLARTYVTLRLRDVAQRVGLPNDVDAEALVLRMIARGDVAATIDSVGRVVRFFEPHAATDADMAAKLQQRLDVAAQLEERVRKENHMLSKDKQFIDAVVRADRESVHKPTAMDTTS